MKFLSQTTTIFSMALLMLSCSNDDDCTTQSFYLDRDMDGFGAGEATEACEAPSASVGQYVLVAGDTDDNDANINPDCDRIFYVDADGDGFGVGEPLTFCEEPSEGSYTDNATDFDCDDDDPDVFPGNTEIMDNGIDDDCDPSTPDALTAILFDFDTNAVDNGDNVTETIEGVTVTVTNDAVGVSLLTPTTNGWGGSSGDVVITGNPATSATFTFDQPVNINSILPLEGIGFTLDYTFTPNDGEDNPPVTVTLVGGFAPDEIPVELNWTDVTSFTVTTGTSTAWGGMVFDKLSVSASL